MADNDSLYYTSSTLRELAEENALLKEIIRELLGQLELVSVMPEAIGKCYVPKIDADFMKRARRATEV